ncbi:hypothetical protein LRM35_05040 [Klebsiella variicola subsp. variicola]|nr:hypothetical protein LRM35_05040 [Klebsiella variicola subsp. variicola]
MLAAKAQLPAVEARLVAKIPFDSQYKYMSTLQHIDGEARVLITGAPDVIFAMCREQMSRHGAGAVRGAVLGRGDGALRPSGTAHGGGGL